MIPSLLAGAGFLVMLGGTQLYDGREKSCVASWTGAVLLLLICGVGKVMA